MSDEDIAKAEAFAERISPRTTLPTGEQYVSNKWRIAKAAYLQALEDTRCEKHRCDKAGFNPVYPVCRKEK